MLNLNLSGRSEKSDTPDLQFDRVSTPGDGASTTNPSASCTACHTQIVDEYYDVNGHAVCANCRVRAVSAAQTPTGLGPLMGAGLFGFGGAILGAIAYYIVAFQLHFGFGLVAILCGYLVGAGVRKGASDRGGRRFQILAILLTYTSIAMAFAPIAVKGFVETANKRPAITRRATGGSPVPDDGTSVTVTPAAGATAGNISADKGGRSGLALVLGLGFLLGLLIALPLIAAFSTMPLGLIILLFMFLGMRQAWRLTAAPNIVVNGPYRVGGAPASPAV